MISISSLRPGGMPGFIVASLLLAADLSASDAAVPERGVVDNCRYAANADAERAWTPMQGSAPARAGNIEGRRVLRLRCNFSGTDIPRASWDRKVAVDLAACRGLEFKVFCRDAAPVSYFSFYLQSGAGWYHAAFFPDNTSGWTTITVNKSEMRSEGSPAGWDRIETVRVSAWRGADQDTEFFLSDIRQIGLLGQDAAVAIIRGDWAGQRQPAEARSMRQAADTAAKTFAAEAVECGILSDQDVTADRLQGVAVVVLPHNPALPDSAAAALTAYLKNGGKLLAFYSVPDPLLPALQVERGRHLPAPRDGYFSAIQFRPGAVPGAPPVVRQASWNIQAVQPGKGAQVLADWVDERGQPTGQAAILAGTNWALMTHVLLPDDPPNKQRMLLALAGRLAPKVWQQTAAAKISAIGNVASFTGYEAAEAAVAGEAKRPAAAQALTRAKSLRKSALDLAAAGTYPGAIAQAEAAASQLLEAYCLAQQPLPGEFRAFWCHSAFGVKGISWDEAARRLAANGFTAVLPNMLWGGAAFYDSHILPVARETAERGDQIKECLAACRKYGLQVHVWKVNWNLGSAAPKEFLEKMRREKRLQASASGKEEPWLCPSHPENQKLEIDSMLEVARNYDVDGIHFDYIRYPDSEHCFCEGCRERFSRSLAQTVQWPQDVLAKGSLRQQWLDWRRANITAVVKAVSEQARAIKPKIRISAAVFRYWNTDRDGVGQDWKLWCDKGYLDFVCPMDYTPINRQFENMVSRQVQWAGKTPCFPGLGVSASSSKFGADRAIEQILIARRHRTGGFVIFNYGARESEELLPLLGKGITARAAD